MTNTLKRLFQYKQWADRELFAALAKIDRESTVVTLSLKALTHTYVVDQIFAAHLRGRSHTFTSANLAQLPTVQDLSVDMAASDREYVDYVSTLEGRPLLEIVDFTFTDGAPGRMSREEMLLHVITHGVGHRGQISAVMLLNSLDPVSDGFTTYLHRIEASARRRAA